MLRKREPATPRVAPGDEENFGKLMKWLFQNALPPDCILVNAQSVADDMLNRSRMETGWDLLAVPRAMPPYSSMWMEFNYPDGGKDRRYAVQTIRTPPVHSSEHTRLYMAVWMDDCGVMFGPGCLGWCGLDESGEIIPGDVEALIFAEPSVPVDEKARSRFDDQWKFVMATSVHAISRMNCTNVELRPIKEGKSKPHAPNKVVPASVWHEIVITSVPKVRTTGQDIFEHEESEIRLHWVRGHYADYRKGNGLFGRIKGLFWIPEHRRGNEELGQIIPEYTIQ